MKTADTVGLACLPPEGRSFNLQKTINLLKHLPLAVLANFYWRFPARKLRIIGVTGTDGKTTTVNIIQHILLFAGKKAAEVSTISAKIGMEEVDTGFHVTSPSPWLLQKLLRRMVDEGVNDVVLEVTSHGLDQFRFWGINFNTGVLTNITHEHLDYHKTFVEYRKAKSKLFFKSKIAVLNKDDESFSFLKNQLKRKNNPKIITYGIKSKADFTPKNFPFKMMLSGEYNKLNCLAGIATTSNLGISGNVIREAVTNFKGVKGRFDEIQEGQNFRIIIDFAHTPNALRQVLTLLRKQLNSKAKLIAVFGAAGLRDWQKRAMMGEVSGKLADNTIITVEDPRTEDVDVICRQIAEGCQKEKGEYKIIPDRQEAINFAIQKLAKKGDILVICGKGHEQSMCFGTTEYPWSDFTAVRKAIISLKKGVPA